MRKSSIALMFVMAVAAFAPIRLEAAPGENEMTVSQPFERKNRDMVYALTITDPSGTVPNATLEAWASDILAKMEKKIGKDYAGRSHHSPRWQREFVNDVNKIAKDYFAENEIKGVRVSKCSFQCSTGSARAGVPVFVNELHKTSTTLYASTSK
jgi:hypothetical protein